MKKTLLAIIMLAYSLSTWAQEDVTRFLGIPVDGTKREMIEKLKAKGFEPHPTEKDCLIGEFNGEEVMIIIQTQNNKVWRIVVGDITHRDAINIKIRFNELCRQFLKNKKYFTLYSESELMIPDDEDIAYNILVNNKRYEAAFLQLPQKNVAKIDSIMQTKYTEIQREYPTEEDKKEMKAIILQEIEIKENNIVWFTINEIYGEFSIAIYYENRRNQANGEDL